MKRFIIVLIAVITIAIVVQADLKDSEYLDQFRNKPIGRVVSEVWLDILELNRERYSDLNMVYPGDLVLLPLERYYVVREEPQGADHMWRAAVYFTNEVVLPYLYPPTPIEVDSIKEEAEERVFPWWSLILLVLFISYIVGVIITLIRRKRKMRSRPPFVSFPLSFDAPERQVRRFAQQALSSTFGRGIEIKQIEKGRINGQQTVFYSDGSYQAENFKNEPGYRAHVRFPDGNERLVVSKWQCFNPCWSAQGAQFKGTFTPDGGKPEEISEIRYDEAYLLSQKIRDLAENLELENEADSSSVPVDKTENNPKTLKEGYFTKVQFSPDKGLNLEGNFPLTIKQLKSLIKEIKKEEEEEK